MSALGYGAMALSLDPSVTEAAAVETLQKVLQSGIRLIDTADTYCRDVNSLHHNERLIARVLREQAETTGPILVATKGGTIRTAEGWQIDGNPDLLYQAIVESFQALGGDCPIPIWQHHWPDPRYSITRMMKAVRRAADEKLIERVGVANYSLEQIREARDVVSVVSVQNQYNLWHREAESDGIIDYCEREGLVFMPWRPMGGLGLAQRLGEIPTLVRLAGERSVSPQCMMIAWHLAKSAAIVPIPGAGRFEHFLDCLRAKDLRLAAGEIAAIDAIPAGELPQRARPAAWRDRPPLSPSGPPAEVCDGSNSPHP